ncbi:MAG: response regulator [Bacillota bacterium]|nr:response regulator [Bacillota bacterium]
MIRAIVVDDEKPSCAVLEKLLIESGIVQVKGCFTEPYEAVEYLAGNKVDAVFLDIEMPEIDGIELSNRILDLQGKIAVIFVTAYNRYAVEAFRLNALDYLMKPVDEERLKETLDRIVEEKNIPISSYCIHVKCFGKFSVETDNGTVKFRTEKAEELLAFFLDQRGAFVSRNRIIDCLWEDYDGERAIVHFNTSLYNVKKALLSQGIVYTIEYDKGNYRLDINQLDCDYLKFLELVSKSIVITDMNFKEYEETAGLYMGEYLSGKESLWLERNRQTLKDLYIGLVLKLTDYYKSRNRYEKVVEWMKKGLVHDPLHTELNFRLMESLIHTGDRISAMQYYEIYENSFRAKLKQEPDVCFRRLFS